MHNLERKRIIIADDDEDDRMLLQSAFQEIRIDVAIEFAFDGSELMKILADETAFQVSFILLDLNMPRKDGREALKEIKESPTLKKIPVIIFTTAKNESEIRKCYDLGANTYIVKPDGFEALRKVVISVSTYWLDTAATPS